MSEKNALAVPKVAVRDAKSFEVLRVWIAEHDQHVSLALGVWQDPAAWGILLADLARHIVRGHGQQTGGKDFDAEQFLERLRDGFDAEFDEPTDEPEGGIVH
jgi:hypothetical protein